MESRQYVMERLRLDKWVYSQWFEPVQSIEMHPVIEQVESYIKGKKLEHHPFFALAKGSTDALKLWATQELVMTNAFSQIVLFAAGAINNVHLRAMISHVAFGEHGLPRKGIARKAHPWLLHQLRESMGIAAEEVRPAPATLRLIERLAESTADPLTAIAWIGVGNERLIIPEYSAITECFESCLPSVNYKAFLDANLNEDIGHSRICYEFASALWT